MTYLRCERCHPLKGPLSREKAILFKKNVKFFLTKDNVPIFLLATMIDCFFTTPVISMVLCQWLLKINGKINGVRVKLIKGSSLPLTYLSNSTSRIMSHYVNTSIRNQRFNSQPKSGSNGQAEYKWGQSKIMKGVIH